MKHLYLTALIATLAISSKAQFVGIGTTTPGSALDVNGILTVRGGAPGNGKVLTSDAAGKASWSNAGLVPSSVYLMSDNPADVNLTSNGYTYYSSTLIDSRAATSITSPAQDWLKSSVFLSPRADAIVMAGNNNDFVIFGGYDQAGPLSNGAIYDPVADSWTAIPDPADGITRTLAAVTWAGGKLVVWGGGNGTTFSNTGKVYDPATRTWTPMSTTGAPTARWNMAAGYNAATNELVIWGGSGGSTPLADGARYNLTNNTWSPISTTNAPTPRSSFAYGVNGGKLFLFGGRIQSSGVYTATAYYYDVASNTWSAIAAASPLAGRWNIRTVYTGNSYVLFGGDNGNSASGFGDGAVFNTTTNTWSVMSSTGAPTLGTTQVAYGNDYFVTGNYKYKLSTGTWSALPTNPRYNYSIGGNATALFVFAGKVPGTGGGGTTTDPFVADALRYFWAPQTAVTHTASPLELYLYRRN